MKLSGVFRDGAWLAMAIACIVTVYAYTKNTYTERIENVLFLFPSLLLIVLIGCAVSYFTYQRVASKLTKAGEPAGLVVLIYLISTCLATALLYRALVKFEVAYGYIVLPMSVMLVGGGVLLVILRVMISHREIHRKLTLLMIIPFVLGVGLLIFR